MLNRKSKKKIRRKSKQVYRNLKQGNSKGNFILLWELQQ